MLNCFKKLKKLDNIKKNRIIRIIIVLIFISILTVSLFSVSYSNNIDEGLYNSLIRLHVIANSDSDSDQELKRDVRDRIMKYLTNKIDISKEVSQAEIFIENNLESIESTARGVLDEKGVEYNVKAFYGIYPFPTKSYGDIKLPAGTYKSLKIILGKGEGSNWWCVIFPPLCFVDITHGTVPDYVKEDLRDMLTEEEYEIIAEADSDDDIPIRVRFKIVEFFQDTKIRFSGIINRIFKTEK
jgi:stage II sporulation protein R